MSSDESRDTTTTIDDADVETTSPSTSTDDAQHDQASPAVKSKRSKSAKTSKRSGTHDDSNEHTTDSAADDSAEPADIPCGDVPLPMRIEAILISTDKPLSDARLIELLGIAAKGAKKLVHETIDALNVSYAETGRSFRIEPLAGGWQILTQPEVGTLLARLHQVRQSSKLSQAALETLSIVAYRQPIMRAEIEAIRGVASGEVLRGLMERRLVKIVGRAEELGRPMLYGTT
ncbi:MAG: SMC-Scp complex subunit ScpB, partial [Phycisphaerales bacterium]|nr:SMC-Scp complex subunit ScpB [Phycisphaerales bacterium]